MTIILSGPFNVAPYPDTNHKNSPSGRVKGLEINSVRKFHHRGRALRNIPSVADDVVDDNRSGSGRVQPFNLMPWLALGY